MSAQRNIQAIYPLTPMQHGMLFHSLLEPGSGVYVEQMSCLLAGDLDAEAFVRAWQLAIQRHEVLRAAFVWQDVPKPLQVIGREVHPEWTREDLSELSEDERRARFEDYLAVDRATGFRLGKAPLLRFALFRNSAVEHRFVWSFHHILMDGWCLPVVLGEVMRCYQSLISNQQPNLPAPPRYEEFVAWLQRQDATQAEQFWRGRLDGLHAPTPLPFTSSSTPGLEDYQQLRVSLSSVLSASLQIVARQERITLNSIFQSAWAILLARLAHTNDVTFGATVSGRPGTVKGIETMVGLFINTLPIRIAVKPEMAVCDWVRENHARMTEALQFECVPLAQIHGWSSVPRGTPLFESVLVFENFPIEQSVREGSASLYVREIKFQQQIDLPLMLTVMPGPQQIAIRLSWDNNRFSDSAMDSIVACVREILASIAAQPHSTVANIRLLDNNTRQTMLAASKAAQASWEGSSLIHKLFTQQVHRTPGNIAVKDSSTQLTYRELDEQSNSLSHQLRGLGVRRGSLVGIYMDRGAHPAVAALAILKAGAAYVPMEPGYPPDRLRWTVDDTHMRVIVTTAAHIATLDEFGVHLLPFDPAAAALRTGPPSVEPLDEHDAAYVIYTSGSTGKPKGVVVEHGSVTNYLRALIRATDLQPDFSWAMVQPLSVDASVTAFYPPLLSGGTLHVIAHDMALDADAVGAYLDRERVDCLKIAPSHLAALQRSTNKYAVMPRRRLILGGEGSDREWALSLLDRQPGCGIWNHYGPTEATVGMLTCEVERDKEELSSTTIPLGRPLSNTQAYLLDQEMEPLPTGSAGELYIGGACLARGYLNRPDLTAASFLPDPFGAHGGRLYRTGDLARFLPNDNLVFLGRKDQQVKIRGYRIELAEIEAALRAYPGIAEAVVDARQIASDDQRLVAYFVASVEPIPSTAPASGDLRRWLKDRLPDHMIPGVFMPLNALPRNAHGKLDRNALPPPTWGELDLTGSTEPSSEAEKILVQIWSEVLRVQHVSVHQNFFELGGDSILSIQIVARAQTQGLRITVKQLFQHQTIAELAAVAEYCTTDSESTQTPVSGPVELTPIQQWFFERNWKEPWHFNQSVLLESREPVNLDGLRAAVAALVFHHDALRTRFQLDQTGWAQEVTNTALDALVMEQVASAVELEERAAHWQKQFDLASGLLLRVVLFRMSPAEADRVLLIAHHLVVDGVSWRVLLEDLERGYSQWRQEQKIELPAKTASFQRWAAHLKQQAASPAVEAEWPYWEQQCTASDTHDRAIPSRDREGAVASLERQPEQIATVSLHLNEEDTRALLQEVPPVYGTRINDVLLTALNEALGTDGQLTVELEGHGREEIAGLNITRTVGWFTVHYPIRLDTRHNEDIADKLKSIKEQLRAVPGGGLGYGLLRYWGADPERRKSLQHSATVSFNYLGQLDSMLPREGLFQAAQESKGSTQSASLTLTHDFIVTANVMAGRLRVRLTYDAANHQAEEVEAAAERFTSTLHAIVEHCRRPESGGYTPSDFPLAKLGQRQLDRWFRGPHHIEDIYPLSPLQQGLLFHSLYQPASGVYLEQMSCTLEGDFDLAAFQKAWEKAMERHAILRTSFLWEDLEEPLQIVHKHVPVPLTFEDWAALPDPGQQQRLAIELNNERSKPFDPLAAPLFRLRLIAGGPLKRHLIWSYHHVLQDGWSGPLLLKNVMQGYDAYHRGVTPVFEPAAPYSDYIAWLQRQDHTAAERFWRSEVGDVHAPTALPAANDDPAESGPSYGILRTRLSAEETTQIETMARKHQLTLNTLTQAAWALLINRYSGESDIIFGATVSGRPAELKGADQTVGLFINTLPVRTRIDPAQTAGDWLRALQDRQAEARQFDYAPLVRIQSWTALPRGTPLFESLLIFENYPVKASLREVKGELAISSVQSKEQTNFALTIEAVPATEFSLRIGYDARRFSTAGIERMLQHLKNALLNLARHADRPVAELDLLTPAERETQLKTWSRGPDTDDQCVSVLDLWNRQCHKTPDLTAVEHAGNQSLSYADLDRRSNQLARFLQRLGIRAGDVVAACCGRTPQLIESILGIWKAGAAYVVLEEKYPDERWRFIIDDTAARLVLCIAETTPRLLTAAGDARLVMLDEEWDDIQRESSDPLESSRHPESCSYVVYTSGSTGTPRGVMVRDAGLGNVTQAVIAHYGLGPSHRRLQFVSPGFDAFGEEIFPLLCSGGTLVVGYDPTAMTTADLLRTLRTERINAVHMPPSYWHALVDEAAANPQSLPQDPLLLVTGAEISSPTQLSKWMKLFPPGSRWINEYGPAEATITSTLWQAPSGSDLNELSRISIGRPLANVRTYILDDNMTLAPAAVAGELYIGGTGLTRGYLNRPNLTAERFIPDPFGASGERLYRTGDLARYLPDGKIEFVGRKDRQVKLRGYRIELGEIESVLRKHPAVRDVVVHACTVAEADKRLAAYLVPATDSIPSAADLRAWLKQRLPEYMIPSAWVLQSELPRGPHGKLNRDALPPPVWEGSGDAAGELTTDAQRKLAAIWTEVLHVDAIGPGDNFFELGGHSLLATQLVSRIQQSFGVAIPLSEVFDKPSLAALAVTIEAAVNTGDGEIAQLLDELETLSDEEAQKLLYEAQTHS